MGKQIIVIPAYNEEATVAQVVRVADVEIPFERGESIWTEASYKYNQDEFADLVAGAGWRVEQMWTDDHLPPTPTSF